jgi:Vitamin K-dependent gamma-carboxylase
MGGEPPSVSSRVKISGGTMQTAAADSRLSRTCSAWSRFWFTPSDPTVLGAIRIITGLVAFYTLIGYSLDLQEFVGQYAWHDLDLRNEEVRESPIVKVPFDWPSIKPRELTTPEEKKYQLYYRQKWGDDPPLPYPKTAEEAKGIDDYRARWGVDPRALLGKGQPVWSVWFHVTDPFWMNVVQSGFVFCGLLFTIGCATRLTNAITWFAVLSFIHRDPASLFGADTMMAVLLLYLMIGPSGAALSVDRLVTSWWARRQGLPAPKPCPSVSANLAVRLVQIHACIIYGAAGLAKLQGQSWWYGIAPWGALANFEFTPMEYPLYVDFLRFLAKTRWLYELTMTIGALGTLAFEIGYPFLIWRPAFRTLWLWIAVLLHAGIGMFLGLRTFSFVMLAFNVAFVSPGTVRWALKKVWPSTWSTDDKAAERQRGDEKTAEEQKGQQIALS